MGIACTKLEGFYLSFYYAIEISACKHILTFLRGERGGKREGEGERGKGREEERVREREGERERSMEEQRKRECQIRRMQRMAKSFEGSKGKHYKRRIWKGKRGINHKQA